MSKAKPTKKPSKPAKPAPKPKPKGSYRPTDSAPTGKDIGLNTASGKQPLRRTVVI